MNPTDRISPPPTPIRLEAGPPPAIPVEANLAVPAKPPRARQALSPASRQEILALHPHYGTRQIARRMGCSRKRVRQVLVQEGLLEPAPPASCPSKLLPYQEPIRLRVEKGLTASRILREIRELGYEGQRTILSTHVRQLRAQLPLSPKQKPQVKRRFETRPGQEMQIDWSPYTIPIAGRPTTVHALGCLLCSSRKLFLRFFRDERQHSLLEGLASAFEYFDGCTLRVVLDNMATAVLARITRSGEPLWHDRFLGLSKHYGFRPFACKPRDSDRKGKKEKSFRLLFADFLAGSEFASLEDLHHRCRVWLDHTPETGNLRVHGTTRLVPNEAYAAERELLIRLPPQRFPVHEEAVRVVDRDSTLSIAGTRYSVPAALANRAVAVRLFAEHFEILGPQGQLAFSRRYVERAEKGKLVIDPTHYANLPRRRHGGGDSGRLDQAFVQRFPSLAPLCEGLIRRMKSLAPIHLRALLRLADRYGQDLFLTAAERAQTYRRFDALAVERILERAHPLVQPDPVQPISGLGPVVLGNVEPASLDPYADFDRAPVPPTSPPASDPDPEKGNGHGPQ